MSDALHQKIRHAQVLAGEQVVMEDLRRRGLLDEQKSRDPRDDEIERLRYIIGALVEWRDKPWSPQAFRTAYLPGVLENPKSYSDEYNKARAETVSVWDAAREAIKPSDRGETG